MTRAEKAGRKLGTTIIEMVHLMYQNETALDFLNAVHDRLYEEIEKRQSGG
ncbi:hypothetical protein KAR91_55275 [Candidatus Pacearchaeota archaeon]|nr:hypothetical protein [Candidatus Pacearchaeota archaeon]